MPGMMDGTQLNSGLIAESASDNKINGGRVAHYSPRNRKGHSMTKINKTIDGVKIETVMEYRYGYGVTDYAIYVGKWRFGTATEYVNGAINFYPAYIYTNPEKFDSWDAFMEKLKASPF